MAKTALDFLRGAVRPVTLLAAVGVTLGLFVAGEIDSAERVAAFSAPIVGFWFGARSAKQ